MILFGNLCTNRYSRSGGRRIRTGWLVWARVGLGVRDHPAPAGHPSRGGELRMRRWLGFVQRFLKRYTHLSCLAGQDVGVAGLQHPA